MSSVPSCPPRCWKPGAGGGGSGSGAAGPGPGQGSSAPGGGGPGPVPAAPGQLTAYDALVQMGVPGGRAAKALVATGGRGVQIASDWLLAHVHDPHLDEETPRKFALYMCPSAGDLHNQLETFWDASRLQIGWNGAHNSFPHLTLASGFSCPDSGVDGVLAIIKRVVVNFADEFRAVSEQGGLHLDKYVSPNFLGLFVGKREELLLRSFAQDVAQSLAEPPLAIQTEPLSKNKTHHVTLAYQFSPGHFDGLEDLASAVDPGARGDWELRLYSYEERTKGMEVFKVLYPHSPSEEDELELMVGDYIYVDPSQPNSESCASSEEGWILGTSWLTGCRGYLPKNFVQRTSETNAWTCHLAIPLVTASGGALHIEDGNQGGVLNPVTPQDLAKVNPSLLLPSPTSSCSSSLERLKGSTSSLNHEASFIPTAKRSAEAISLPPTTASGLDCSSLLSLNPGEPRRLYIVRHGERVDFTFGANWIPICFNREDGTYQQRDLNLPASVPRRRNSPESFLRDCPLTCMGVTQATMVGEALRATGVNFAHAYVSPSLRCVQTCHALLKAMKLEGSIKMCIEPGLFEWLAWHQNADWMTPEELVGNGYNINLRYKPYISAEELQNEEEESCEQYYTRSFFVTQCILQATSTDARRKKRSSSASSSLRGRPAAMEPSTTQLLGGNVLFVAHAATLDVCTRQMVGESPRSMEEMLQVIRRVPYCSLGVLEEEGGDGRAWKLVEPPVPPLTHTNNSRFNWEVLRGDSGANVKKK